MVSVTIRFFFQEQHHVQGNLTERDVTYQLKNEDEADGFMKGISAACGKVYQGFEEVEVKRIVRDNKIKFTEDATLHIQMFDEKGKTVTRPRKFKKGQVVDIQRTAPCPNPAYHDVIFPDGSVAVGVMPYIFRAV